MEDVGVGTGQQRTNDAGHVAGRHRRRLRRFLIHRCCHLGQPTATAEGCRIRFSPTGVITVLTVNCGCVGPHPRLNLAVPHGQDTLVLHDRPGLLIRVWVVIRASTSTGGSGSLTDPALTLLAALVRPRSLLSFLQSY